MTFDIVTIFPAMIEQAMTAGIVGRAIERGTLDVKVHELRNFTTDRHRVVDDAPYGGGPGMVLKAEPIFRALDAIERERGRPLAVVLTSPQGTRLTHWAVRATFVQLSRQIGLRGPSDSHGPRLHDFRHRFAVQTLVRWSRDGGDGARPLPERSTSLGHVKRSAPYGALSAPPAFLG